MDALQLAEELKSMSKTLELLNFIVEKPIHRSLIEKKEILVLLEKYKTETKQFIENVNNLKFTS